MAYSNPGGAGLTDAGPLVWGSATASGAAAFTGTTTASLPQGGTGRPLRLKAFGSVAGFAQIQIGNAQVVQCPIAPNIVNETSIPQSAFPGPINGITVLIIGLGAGTSVALVGFKQ